MEPGHLATTVDERPMTEAIVGNISKPPRVRRKSMQGEHAKHRRTRSGCYTCRTRRVKCDEAQPMCERCKKGRRQCSYPDPPTTTKASARRRSRAGPATEAAAESSSSDGEGNGDEDDDDEGALSAVLDEEDERANTEVTRSTRSTRDESDRPSPERQSSSPTWKDSKTPSLTQEKSPASSTDGSVAFSGPVSNPWPARTARKHLEDLSSASAAGTTRAPDWSHLPTDLQFYLNYHQNHITHYTYSFRHDAGHFLQTTLLSLALQNKALLYAVVGFAAFQYALTRPKSKLQDFLGYYTISVTHLRSFLSSERPHTVATLLTILQLATVEECLGDWVNLKSHQRAAYKLLTELYTPTTMMRSDMDRAIFDWYTRFDLFAGFLAGSRAVLSHDWFITYHQYYLDQVQLQPENLVAKMDEALANYRLLAMELMTIFAHRDKSACGDVAASDVAGSLHAIAELTLRFNVWRDEMDPALLDPVHRISDFTGARERGPDDIVDPFAPGVLFGGKLWRMNYALLGWCSTDMLLKQQSARAVATPPSPTLAIELESLALRVCQTFEAIEYWPGTPPGGLLSAQSALGLAVLILPKDERHTMWFRRKFAKIESMGYIFAPSFRNKMATLWSLPSVHQWWLPSEASMPPIVRSIRSFVDDRATSPPNDSPSSDLKEMKGIFRAMKLSDDAIPTATPILGRRTNEACSPSASSPATTAVSSQMDPSPNMPPHHDMAILTLPAATAPPHRPTNLGIPTKSPIV